VKTHRLAGAALTAFAAAMLALTGCAASGTPSTAAGASGSPSPPASDSAARSAIIASTQALRTTSFTFTLTSAGLTGQGATDPNAKNATLSMNGTVQKTAIKVDLAAIGSQAWAKLDLGGQNGSIGIPTKWMHVDLARLGAGSGLGVDISGTDPGDTSALFAGVVDAQKIDDRHYQATIDLTKATGASVDQNAVSKLGGKAKAVPATVTLDNQGRLANLKLDLSTLDSSLSSTEIGYANYGSPVTVTRPAAADVVEAPDTVYNVLHG
jgi:hypothetical protein